MKELSERMKPVPVQFPELDLDALLAEVEAEKLQNTFTGLANPSEVNPIASYGGDAIVKSP